MCIRDREYRDTISGLTNKNIVVAHEAFGYLCDAYGLKQVGIEGLSPDSEPDPAKMGEVIDFVRENHVKVIFFEEPVSYTHLDVYKRQDVSFDDKRRVVDLMITTIAATSDSLNITWKI